MKVEKVDGESHMTPLGVKCTRTSIKSDQRDTNASWEPSLALDGLRRTGVWCVLTVCVCMCVHMSIYNSYGWFRIPLQSSRVCEPSANTLLTSYTQTQHISDTSVICKWLLPPFLKMNVTLCWKSLIALDRVWGHWRKREKWSKLWEVEYLFQNVSCRFPWRSEWRLVNMFGCLFFLVHVLDPSLEECNDL